MNRTLERILPKVQKPARYTGGEYNAVVKDRAQVDTRYALCFPDTYEIGMSNLGMRILYGAMNQVEGLWCERAFAPWGDMEEEMRREGIQLYGLESGDPLCDFDIIGFSLGYEMAYTNVLNMLDLAGLPLRSEERRDLAPLVVAGGTCAYNPEPLAPFVDFFVLGEGEEVTLEYIALYRRARDEDWTKEELLREAARIPGIYVPSFYEPVYRPDGTLEEMRIREGSGAPELVRKRVVEDMNKSYFPVKTIIPSTEIVHDRVMLELFRGCIRGCRFCQAGYVYRPVRSRDPKQLAEYGKAACEDSGYQEMTLSSLSSTDYPCLLELQVEDNVIVDRMSGRRVCEKCGASYHIVNKKSKVEGVCDLCGGKTVIRKDDQPATVLDRLKAYHEQTEPLVEFYRTRGKLAEIKFCPSIEETTAEVMKALEA